jgi:hypothetical protein
MKKPGHFIRKPERQERKAAPEKYSCILGFLIKKLYS